MNLYLGQGGPEDPDRCRISVSSRSKTEFVEKTTTSTWRRGTSSRRWSHGGSTITRKVAKTEYRQCKRTADRFFLAFDQDGRFCFKFRLCHWHCRRHAVDADRSKRLVQYREVSRAEYENHGC